MLQLTYYNDGKKKYQSAEISVEESEDFYKEISNDGTGVFNHNIFDITGYGETKEEAIENFKKKFDYITQEIVAFNNLLQSSDVLTNSIVNIDRFGNHTN